LAEETCVLDPVEFIPERVELALDQLGLQIRAEGVDWGESQITPQMVRQAEGETSSDGHRQGVQIRIPIRVKEEGEVSLAEAAHKLQQKVGTIQEHGGWIRRDFDEDGGFAGSIGYKVLRHTLSISGLQGWLFAHRRDAPDVVLTATRWPTGYSTEEREAGTFTTAAGARHLLSTEAASQGSAKGLWCGRFENTGSEDLRGLIFSRECIYAPDDLADPTAQLHYLAKNLTPKGGAEVKTVEGAEVVQHTALTAGRMTILSSEIVGEGHMTHRGPRPMWMRILDQGSEPGGIRLQLLSRALGATRWDESLPIISTPAVGAWIPVFLGVPRAEEALLGDQRWEWKLTAWAPGGSGALRIRDVYPLSSEQYLVLREPEQPPVAEAQKTHAPGSVTSDASMGTVAWTSPANAKASDNSYASIKVSGAGTISNYLKALQHGFALPVGARPVSAVGIVEKSSPEGGLQFGDHSVHLFIGGVPVGPNKAQYPSGGWPVSDAVFIYEWTAEDLASLKVTRAQTNAEDFGFGLAFEKATGTEREARVDRMGLTLYYTEQGDEDKVCFTSRSLEVRSDGVVRQHPTADAWGHLGPDGFLPFTPAGGLEERQTRTIAIPSAGDLTELPDGAAPGLSLQTFSRDGVLFAREAS